MFDQLVADVESFLSKLKSARDPGSPGGVKITIGEGLELIKLGTKCVADLSIAVASFAIK